MKVATDSSNNSSGNGNRLVVLGAGPGGYPAAFRASQLGFQVTLVDPRPEPGGVCLYEGCIPSKALLHVARLLNESKEVEDWGVRFAKPRIDVDRLRERTREAVMKLTGGLSTIAKREKVEYVRGRGRFTGANEIEVETSGKGSRSLSFDRAIVATGSRPTALPGADLERSAVWSSATALELPEVPRTLLVVGGGYIGLEMGTIYSALGSKVTVVEMTDSLLPGVDEDLVRPLWKRLENGSSGGLEEILVRTRVETMEPYEHGMSVELTHADGKSSSRKFSRVLVAIGRRPNTEDLGLDAAGVDLDDNGFIRVDGRQATSRSHIFAVGDVAGEPMLAHKASHEGRIAAEAASGRVSVFDGVVPAVVFTDPEIAWTGLTETKAREDGTQIQVARFPWSASGKAIALGRSEGLTKLVLEPRTERVLGMGVSGVGAGELIAEGTLAVEMGAKAEDLAATIHAHPTLSETVMETAADFFGVSPHLP